MKFQNCRELVRAGPAAAHPVGGPPRQPNSAIRANLRITLGKRDSSVRRASR
jgi:ribosomal protein S12